ncbi:MAG: methyltransferase [Bacteroidales bacterium]|nr:methyltransferase [Bacteroidales bacterium]MDT8373079.1 methyltransferase [Bacteroidales bacterium]
MANNYIKFKQFTIHQEYASFKVTTDSVLLGAWADLGGCRTVLDIGTGTGILTLMAAQRSSAKIVAIEPDRSSFMQAGLNFAACPWHERLTLYNNTIQEYKPDAGLLFDAIITNPPYFVDSLFNPDEGKARARHNVSLSYDDLAGAAVRLLAPAGTLHLVLPGSEAERLAVIAAAHDLHCIRRLLVRPTPELPPALVLMSLKRGAMAGCEESSMVIEEGGRHQYSEEYVSLTKDFYLKF